MRFTPAALAFLCLFALPGHALEGGGSMVSLAKRYEGMNARQIGLHRRTLWCGAFLAHVARKAGKPVPRHPDLAANWRNVGRAIARPRPGAIALVANGRRGKGRIDHVGIVAGVDAKGNPILISGNHRNAVREATYPSARIVGYRVL